MLANSNAMAAIIQPGEREAFEQKMLAAVRERGAFDWEGQATVRGQTRWLRIASRPTLLPGRTPF